MPTHIEQELGLVTATNRIRRWFRRFVPEGERGLDPITVNYEAWRVVRQHVRKWPQYLEAPNCIDVYVSPEDWEDYWGIDSTRKEAGVASFVRARAADKGYWMAGDPQVYVEVDEAIEVGEVSVACSFVEPLNKEEAAPLSDAPKQAGGRVAPASVPPFLKGVASAEQTARLTPEDLEAAREGTSAPVPTPEDVDYELPFEETPREAPTMRFIENAPQNVAFLVGEGSFRLEIHSGDCIGAVRWGEEVPPEVNVRLDADGFPYVDVMQCSLVIQGGRWAVINHAPRGTRLTKRDGARYMLSEPEPCTIEPGDVLWLGPRRPLTFALE